MEMRCFRRIFISAAIGLCGCSDVPEGVSSSANWGTSVSTAGHDQAAGGASIESPFMVVDRDAPPEPDSECVRATLHVNDVGLDQPLNGKVTIVNACAFAVAVLTGPVEVRTRFAKKTTWAWEGMMSPYARLYLYRRDVGKTKYAGDAGMPVFGAPDVAVVPKGGTTELPLVGGVVAFEVRGEYGCFFETVAVRSLTDADVRSAIDLAQSVERHNKRHIGAPRLPRAGNFLRVSAPDVFFEVK
jgi:hypothetical protein